MTKFARILIPLLAFACAATAPAQQRVSLFNGKNLDGWKQLGGKAKYTVENGVIVGATVAGEPNSFICTTKDYGDFILELEFKVDAGLNSGVQIRSECFNTPKDIVWNGETIKMPAGRVHGYQVEIDADKYPERAYTGGIWDEARRKKWIFPVDNKEDAAFSAQGMRAYKHADWNHLRVEARGDSLKTWLNGELRTDITDSMTASGFIGLQVHGIGKGPAKVGLKARFRNIYITTLDKTAAAPAAAHNTLTDAEKAAGWRLLWDGKTTDGWRKLGGDTFPATGWSIKDGVLTVHKKPPTPPQPKGKDKAKDKGKSKAPPAPSVGGNIITKERFSDFELRLDFKITPGANSGIIYFTQNAVTQGLEYQILDDALHPDAKKGRDRNRVQGSLYDLIAPAADKVDKPIGEWNTARIVVRGNHAEHWLNGKKVLEYDRSSPAFRELVEQSKFNKTPNFAAWPDGHILLQDHGDEVSFRNIKILVPAK